MAIAFVRANFASAASGNPWTVTLPSNTAGNLLVLACMSDLTAAKFTVTDSAGNIWQTAGLMDTGNNRRLRLFYAENINASAGTNTITVTCSTGAFHRVGVAEYSGIATAGAFGNANSAIGSSAAAATSSFACVSGDLIIGVSFMLGGSIAAGTGFTSRAADSFMMLEDKVTGSASDTAATTGGNNAWAIIGAAFHPTSPASTAPYVNGDMSGSTGSTTEAAVFPSNVAGNLLVALIQDGGGATSETVTDTAGNSWTLLATVTLGVATDKLLVYYCAACLASSGQNKVTITSANTAYHGLYIAEFSSTPATSQASSTANTAGSSPLSAGSLTAFQNALIIGAALAKNRGTAPGSGYTRIKTDDFGFIEFKTSSASENPSITFTSTGAGIIGGAFSGIPGTGVPLVFVTT